MKKDKEGDSSDEGSSGGDGSNNKEECRIANMAKTRTSLFEILCDRTRDITSFTRAASLKVLNDLTEKQSLPLDRIMPVTVIAIDRLKDKTVMVRRNAMQVRKVVACENLQCIHAHSSPSLTFLCTLAFDHSVRK
jgi:condensin complex subunit 1